MDILIWQHSDFPLFSTLDKYRKIRFNINNEFSIYGCVLDCWTHNNPCALIELENGILLKFQIFSFIDKLEKVVNIINDDKILKYKSIIDLRKHKIINNKYFKKWYVDLIELSKKKNYYENKYCCKCYCCKSCCCKYCK